MRSARPGPRGNPRGALKNWVTELRRHSAARARARLAPVRPGERVLAVALTRRDELVVATDWALYHEASGSWTRIGWEDVGKVDWDAPRRVLALAGLTPAAPAAAVLRLARDWDLPAVASERVTWTCVLDQRLSLNGSGGARVLARRVPGQPGLRWVVIVDNGLDPGDPVFRAALGSALRDLRAVTGV
jgi:hypothetical protein